MKFEILTFSPAQRKFIQFFCPELETRVQILLKLSTAVYCQDRKLMCRFSPQAISLLDETNRRNLKFDLLACSKKFYHFLLGWIGKHNSDFAETFHNPSLSGEETVVSIFCSGNLSLRKNQPMKFEILICSPARRKFT